MNIFFELQPKDEAIIENRKGNSEAHDMISLSGYLQTGNLKQFPSCNALGILRDQTSSTLDITFITILV